MTDTEKGARREARYHGDRCRVYLTHFAGHQREAHEWQKVLGADADHTRLWQQRADRAAEDAYQYARKAAHHASFALAAREGRS